MSNPYSLDYFAEPGLPYSIVDSNGRTYTERMMPIADPPPPQLYLNNQDPIARAYRIVQEMLPELVRLGLL